MKTGIKRMLMGLLFTGILPPLSVHAQSTQIKRLLEQIAALKVYIQVLEKGYEIAKDGLTLIGDIKDGDLLQHTKYMLGLKTVSPAVLKDPKAAEIAELYKRASLTYHRSWTKIESGGMFTAGELEYMAGVYGRVLSDCDQQLEDLNTLLTDTKLVMKDDERLSRISNIRDKMTDNDRFVKHFSVQALLMGDARKIQNVESKVINQY